MGSVSCASDKEFHLSGIGTNDIIGTVAILSRDAVTVFGQDEFFDGYPNPRCHVKGFHFRTTEQRLDLPPKRMA